MLIFRCTPTLISCWDAMGGEATNTPPLLRLVARPVPERTLPEMERKRTRGSSGKRIVARRSARTGRFEIFAPGCSPWNEKVLLDEGGICLSPYGAALRSDRFTNWSAPGKQAYLEDVINPFIDHDLEASGQTRK